MLFLWAMEFAGGVLYLLNKVFLGIAERTKSEQTQRLWKIWSWLVYLFGLPVWVYILAEKHNWIALAVELSGGPSMILGLWLEWKMRKVTWLKQVAFGTVILGILASLIGSYYSISSLGWFYSYSQIAEVGLAVGFLVGTYLLAVKNSAGYLWFLLMGLSALSLFVIQQQLVLAIFQILSVGFVVDAYRKAKQEKNNEN